LDAFLAYLPRLISAIILFAIAWLMATTLRSAVRKILSLFGARVGASVQNSLQGETSEERTIEASSDRPVDFIPETNNAVSSKSDLSNVSEIIASGIYWLVLLLALPPILSALNIL